MMLRPLLIALPLALALAWPSLGSTQQNAGAAVHKTFDQHLEQMLTSSREQRRGLVFHIKGQKIAGVVKETSVDAVVVANQEHARILIRREGIDAIEGD